MVMNAAGEEILVCLSEVAAQRAQREQEPALGRAVDLLLYGILRHEWQAL